MNLISRFIVVLYHMIIDCQDPNSDDRIRTYTKQFLKLLPLPLGYVTMLEPHNGPVSHRTHGTTEAGQVGLEPTTIPLTAGRSTN